MRNKAINILLALIVLCLAVNSDAQNLIPNGSFEEYTTDNIAYVPKQLKNIKGGWEYLTTSRTLESPDIIVIKGSGNNKRTWGDGSVILFYKNYQTTDKNALCKTIFQVPLIENLSKDAFYRLSIDIRITGFGKYESYVNPKLVQFYLLNAKIEELDSIYLLQLPKSVGMLPEGKTYHDYYIVDCIHLFYDYRAVGGEKYLIFGTVDTSYSKEWTSFMIDDIKLEQINGNTLNLARMHVGSTLVIENILFETNKAVLQTSSYKPLNQLVAGLMRNPSLKIEISGHTDNTGSKEHNLELSELRAKAVVTYLVQKGISTSRLSYKGFGDSKPIVDNSSEKGRKQNRRVEIMVLEK